MEQKSVFELILSGELDSEIIYDDDEIFDINDINHVAKVHILIIPKRKIETINDASLEDQNLLGKMILVAKDLAKKHNINQSGYRLLFNTNSDAMQTVFHIHLHLIGGEKLKNI
jgi:histidine triad (HIT) family protein